MKLLELYKSVLLAAGLTSDDEGFVYVNNKLFTGEENAPAMIGDQRIVLPTDEQMRHPSKDKIIFHPLREQAMRGESAVFTKLRTSMTARLNFTFAVLIGAMLDVAKRVDIHKTLSPAQAQLLNVGKSITEKTHEIFSEVCLRTMSDPSMSFVAMFMKKSDVVNNQPYRRIGVVSFPVYEELCKEQDKYFGLTIKPAERENLKAVMQFLLPGIETVGKYNKGSNSDVAPYMDALMMVFGGIAGPFNDKIELFEKFIPESDIITIDSDWVEVFDNLDAHRVMIQMVPQQAGNEGASLVQGSAVPTVQMPQHSAVLPSTATAKSLPVMPTANVNAPQVATQPTGKQTFSEMIANAPHLQQYRNTSVYPGGVQPAFQSPTAPRGQWFAPPQQMGMMPQQYGQPMYGQPMMQQQTMYGQQPMQHAYMGRPSIV